MPLAITGSTVALTTAINEFSAKYHDDYFLVRTEAVAYLCNPPDDASAMQLASLLLDTLKRWGAEKRGAPSCQSLDAAKTALKNPILHQQLKDLADSFTYLAITKGARCLRVGAPFRSVAEFDACLIKTLNDLAGGVLVGNTNVTYPMKGLLLITGLMPAFDSQVKGGAAVAGLLGMKLQSYRLRPQLCTGTKKICALPFYIADCVSRSAVMIDEAIKNSARPNLRGHHGRLFDILLFMQKDLTPDTALIRYASSRSSLRWYSI